MTPEKFQEATMKTLMKILKKDNIKIKKTKGSQEFFVYDEAGKEIFHIYGSNSHYNVDINGVTMKQWTYDAREALYKATEESLYQHDAVKQTNKEQQATTDFLASFLNDRD